MNHGREESRLHVRLLRLSRWLKKMMGLRPILSPRPAPMGMKKSEVIVR